ncbi:alpha carbonic anhydrase [Pyronema domesticum]|nr:alpha carbonic anhydrase [Pyronema domesticum]
MHSSHRLLLLSLLPLALSSCIDNTRLKPRAATGAVPISTFGYTGLLGPLNWAGLSPANSACSTSLTQSPINIDPSIISLLPSAPVLDFPSVAAAEFENLGSTIEVITNGTTTIDGTTFNLKQFHFHAPSEHRINEEFFPLEVHMVHESATGELAVVALMFQLSSTETTELLTKVTENIDKIQTPGTRTETGALDFGAVVKHVQTTPLFTYKGSLTTPPCAEGLTFIIPQAPLPVNVETFNKIKSTVKFNSRYTQNDLGKANILDVGCTAAAGAKIEAGKAVGGNGTAVAPAPVTQPAAGKQPSHSVAPPVVAPPAASAAPVEAPASALPVPKASSAVKEEAATGAGAQPVHHCIMGACHTVPAAPARRARRWFQLYV